MRIVSLIASATEIVAALGAEDQLVGRSHECDYPPSVRGLPICTEPRFDVTGSSAEIDRLVREVLRESASVYQINTLMLEQVRPDVLLTQAHCDVCAVNLADVEAALRESLSIRPRVVALMPNTLADVWMDIQRVADAIGQAEQGERLVASMRARIRGVSMRARSWGKMPTIACIEWIDPLMVAGNWIPEMIDLAGGVNIFSEAGKHSPTVAWERFVRLDPEVIVVTPCGFDIARTRAELPALTSRPEWRRLRAVETGRVWVADGNAFFNRPGPRLVESLEMLAEAIQPAAFRFGYEGLEML